MVLIAMFLSGSLLILAFFGSLAKQDSWIIVVVSFFGTLPLIGAYVYISKRFVGKTIIEIHEIVYGKLAGKIISVLYVLFFLALLSFNIRDVSIFYSSTVMPDLPPAVFVTVTTLVCAYAAKKGVKTIARVGFVVFVIVVVSLVITMIFLIGDMDFQNMLPLFELPTEKFVQASLILTLVPFGEIVLFLMIMPHISENKKLGKFSIGGLGIAALIFMSIIIRNTTVLGAGATINALSAYQSVRMINVGDFITRVELLIALNQTASIFMKISVLYYACVKGLAQITKLKSYTPIILPVGAIAVFYALTAHSSEVDHARWGTIYAAFFELPFVVVLPLVTLLLALIRKLPRKGIAAAPRDNG